ncbi:MAG: hypothetical protein JWP12_2477 [Bacteroidetes bacterium]|nr:hypothetical protein [Bacteroidota bacterium]
MKKALGQIIVMSMITAFTSCNGERNKVETEIAGLRQQLNDVKKGFTLSKNYYYHSSISSRKQEEEGIFSYIDTAGPVIIEIHKHVMMNPSYMPMSYFIYYDNGVDAKWKNVKSCLTTKRYELIGDSTFIKQELNRPGMDKTTKAILVEQNMDTTGIRMNPTDIKTEQLVGIFSTGVDANRSDMDDTDLNEFLNDVGKQIEKQPNDEIKISYGYMGGSGAESNYVLTDLDKELLLDTYHFYLLQNKISDCKKKLSKL